MKTREQMAGFVRSFAVSQFEKNHSSVDDQKDPTLGKIENMIPNIMLVKVFKILNLCTLKKKKFNIRIKCGTKKYMRAVLLIIILPQKVYETRRPEGGTSTVQSSLLEYGAAAHIFTDTADGNDENQEQEVQFPFFIKLSQICNNVNKFFIFLLILLLDGCCR